MASGAIKGITVEIGGDTTKLGKAIGETEKKSRSLQVELRQVEKLLKFDPTNTELLTQKQNILADAIIETSKKLDTLKEAERQVIAQFEKGEVSEEQVRALQREIIQTEKTLGDMRSELQTATRNLEEFGDNNGVAKEAVAKLEKEIREQNDALEAEKKALQEAEKAQKEHEKAVADAKEELADFGEKASEAFNKFKTGVAVIGGATVAGAGYALNLSTNFDKAFNTLITRTGASKDEMDGLNTAMENVYANNFGESIEDVAESMATVKTATNLTGKELESVTQNALLMRDTFGFEVNESIRAVNSLMDQFGISADEAYTLIAQGAQKGLNQNDDLLDTINEYSVQFENAGYTAEDMFNMLANGVESGTWSVDKLGDAVKEFNIRMSDGSAKDAVEALGFSWESVSESWSKGGDSAKEVFNMLFNELDGLENTTEGYGIGVGLLGTMYEDLGQDAVLALSKTEGEISKTSDALNKINETKYDDIGSALQGLGRTLETDVVNPLGDELKPVVEDAIEYVKANGPQIKAVLSNVVDKVGEFVGFIVDHGSIIISIIAGIATGLIAWNVASVIMTVVGAIKSFVTIVKSGTTVMKALNMVLNANPMMLLVTVITAVIGAIVTFIATNEDARAKIVEIWNKIKSVVGGIIDALATFFTETIPNAIGVVIDWFESLPEKIRAGIATAVTVVTNIFNSIRNAISTAVNAIKTIVSAVFNTIKTIITAYVNAWKTVITTVWNAIKTIVTGAVNAVKTIITTVFNAVKTFITTVFNAYKTIITGVWNSIKTSVTTIINGVKTTITNVFNIIKTTISTVMNTIKSTISNVWNTIKSTVSSVVNGIKTVISSIFNAIKALLSGNMSAVKSNLTTAWNAIKSTISAVVNGIKSIISSVFNGIKSTVSTIVNGIKSTISSVWNGIKSTTSSVFNGIKSTMSNALNSAKSSVVNACRNILSGMKNVFSNVGSTFRSIGSNVIDGIKNGISGAVSGLYNSIKNALGGLVDKAKEALGINSPSRVFANVVGKQIPAGIAMGVDDNTDIADNAVEAMTDDLVNHANNLNGATIKRKLSTTFSTGSANLATDNTALLSKLDGIYERLNRLQIVLDTGTLVGETIDKIDAGLATRQLLSARGV